MSASGENKGEAELRHEERSAYMYHADHFMRRLEQIAERVMANPHDIAQDQVEFERIWPQIRGALEWCANRSVESRSQTEDEKDAYQRHARRYDERLKQLEHRTQVDPDDVDGTLAELSKHWPQVKAAIYWYNEGYCTRFCERTLKQNMPLVKQVEREFVKRSTKRIPLSARIVKTFATIALVPIVLPIAIVRAIVFLFRETRSQKAERSTQESS